MFILELLHLAHQGYQRMKENAKTLYWWKFLNRDLKNLHLNCDECAIYHRKFPKDPLRPIVSAGPMNLIHADPFHLQGQNYLAVKDGFSGWLFCYKLPNLSSEAVIKPFEQIMDYFGKFDRLITDNATCFTSFPNTAFQLIANR